MTQRADWKHPLGLSREEAGLAHTGPDPSRADTTQRAEIERLVAELIGEHLRVEVTQVAGCDPYGTVEGILEAAQAIVQSDALSGEEELREALTEARETLANLNAMFGRDFGKRSEEIDLQVARIDAALNPKTEGE